MRHVRTQIGRDSMNGAYYAYNDWVRTTRDPRASYTDKLQAFNHYTESLNVIQSRGLVRKRDWNRQSSWLELKDRLETILRDWVERVIEWFRTGTTPSSAQLDQFEREVAEEMETAFESLADDVYQDAMEDTAEEIEGFRPQFGGRHERALNTLVERSTVPDTFRSLSQEAGNVLIDTMEDAFREGEQNIDAIVNRVTDQFGTHIFPDAEAVARSEAFKVWNQAKRETFKEAEERRGEEFLYAMVRDLGPTPRGNPQCEVCTEIIKRTRDGVTWEELVDIVVEVSTDPEYGGSPSWDPVRDSDAPLPHVNCRHTFSRVQE